MRTSEMRPHKVAVLVSNMLANNEIGKILKLTDLVIYAIYDFLKKEIS